MSFIAGEGGSPKLLNDGQVVAVQCEFSRGFSELQGTRDIVVSLCEEIDRINTYIVADRAALAGSSNTFSTYVSAVAGLTAPSRTSLKLIGGQQSEL